MKQSSLSIFFWCPIVNPGGGHRLLTQLVNAVVRHPKIKRVRLAVPPEEFAFLKECGVDQTRVELVSLALDAGNKFRRWVAQDARILGIKGTRSLKYRLRKHLNRGQTDAEHKHLLRLLDGFDVFYAFWPLGTTLPKVPLPIVSTVHDAINFEFPEILGPTESNALAAQMRQWLDHSQTVVVSSQYTGERLRQIFPDFSARIQVVDYFAMPVEASAQTEFDACKKFSLEPGYVIHAANITAHKNHYNLLLAWSRLKQPKPPLVLFGGGTQNLNRTEPDWPPHLQSARLLALIRRLGLQPGKDFKALGFVDDKWVRSLVQNAGLMVLPSLAEGGSFPVEEALHLGTPVACTHIPVMREHLRERRDLVAWFDPESPDAIADAIREVLANLPAYRAKARLASSRPRPTWESIAEVFYQLFHQALVRPAK